MIRLEHCVVTAGGARILDDVSLEVARGRIVAIVGVNGAGKTTVLEAICGEVPNLSGTVTIGGRVAVAGSRSPGVGRVFQGSPLPQTLTVAEVALLATSQKEAAFSLMERFGLAPHASSFVAELSTGMRRIVDLAIATAGAPAVLLLDEPSSGLARAEIDLLARLVAAIRAETGATVVLVEHDPILVTALADEVVVMDRGRIVARGAPAEVLHRVGADSLPRVGHPSDAGFGARLARVMAAARPARR